MRMRHRPIPYFSTKDGFRMKWKVVEIEEIFEENEDDPESEPKKVELTVKVTMLNPNCPQVSAEERIRTIGNVLEPNDYWFDDFRIISDWKYRSIYVVYEYKSDEVWGENYDTREFYGQGDSDSRFSFS